MLEEFKQYLPAKGFKFYDAETPMDNKVRLHKKGATQLRFKQKEIEVEAGAVKRDTSFPYREVVGSSLRLANGSRPNISFAVNQVAKYCCDCPLECLQEDSALPVVDSRLWYTLFLCEC